MQHVQIGYVYQDLHVAYTFRVWWCIDDTRALILGKVKQKENKWISKKQGMQKGWIKSIFKPDFY